MGQYKNVFFFYRNTKDTTNEVVSPIYFHTNKAEMLKTLLTTSEPSRAIWSPPCSICWSLGIISVSKKF